MNFGGEHSAHYLRYGQASRPCAEGAGPGRQGLQRQGAQRGVVRRHHVRPNQTGMAVHGGRDGRLVAQGRGLVDGAEDDGRAGGRRAEDGDIDQEAQPGLHPPQRPRLPVRVAARGKDHARSGHQAVDGRDIVAVGQRGHRVADGVHKVRVRARPHLRQPRAGSAGDIRRAEATEGHRHRNGGLDRVRGRRVLAIRQGAELRRADRARALRTFERQVLMPRQHRQSQYQAFEEIAGRGRVALQVSNKDSEEGSRRPICPTPMRDAAPTPT